MPHFPRSTFVFGPELGSRLKALRRRRSLTLGDVCVLMDRHGAGASNLLSRLERGDPKHPSVGLLLDYLRACGAGPQDVAALLTVSRELSIPPLNPTLNH